MFNRANDITKCSVGMGVEERFSINLLLSYFLACIWKKKELKKTKKFNLTNCIFDSKWLLQYSSPTDTRIKCTITS